MLLHNRKVFDIAEKFFKKFGVFNKNAKFFFYRCLSFDSFWSLRTFLCSKLGKQKRIAKNRPPEHDAVRTSLFCFLPRVGKISRVTDDFVVLEISEGVEIKVQKFAVGQSLPKGTLKSI